MLRKSARSIWISTINKMVEHQPRKRTIHVLLNRTVLLATNTQNLLQRRYLLNLRTACRAAAGTCSLSIRVFAVSDAVPDNAHTDQQLSQVVGRHHGNT